MKSHNHRCTCQQSIPDRLDIDYHAEIEELFTQISTLELWRQELVIFDAAQLYGFPVELFTTSYYLWVREHLVKGGAQ